MGGFPKTKPPPTKRALDSWIRDLARAEGQVESRLRLRAAHMIVAAVLASMLDGGGSPLFILKGGVAMQLRFDQRARSSADIDMVGRLELDLLEATLDDTPSHPIGPFVVRAIGKPHRLGPTGAIRQQLRVEYTGTAWAKVYLEVSPPEGRSVDLEQLEVLAASPDLTVLGLPSVDPISCMPTSYQIAQKLHACTEVKDDGSENARFHDLLDLQLLAELVDDWSATRVACEEVFGLRRKQPWPPTITVPASWPDGYARLAASEDFPVADVYEAAAIVEAMIERICTV
jgi:hypothetical protein